MKSKRLNEIIINAHYDKCDRADKPSETATNTIYEQYKYNWRQAAGQMSTLLRYLPFILLKITPDIEQTPH